MASGLVRSALVASLLLSGTFLLVLYPVCGDNPSYTECRPHIDATIRDLAAKAIHAGETPSDNLEQLDYASADALSSAPPPEAPITAEAGKPVSEPAPPEEPPAPIEPPVSEAVAVEEPPAPEPAAPAEPVAVEEPLAPEPVVVEGPPAPEPVAVEAPPVPEPAVPEAPPPPAVAPPAPAVAPPAPVVVETPVVKEAAAEPVKTIPEPAKPASPVKALPKGKPSIGFINKIVEIIFGLPKTEREAKWAQPWQTHKEFQKRASEAAPVDKPKIKVPSGGLFDWFITLIFGKPPGVRDAKWIEPWQTHKEHKKLPAAEAPVTKKIETSKGGILNSIISLIFGSPSHPREGKWAEPWQTHKEHRKAEGGAPKEEKKIIAGPSGGIIDKIVKLVFKTVPEGTKRDPKWAQPWQTHAEHAKKAVPAAAQEVKKAAPVVASGGILDSFIKIIFPVPKDIKRDPKWAQPWQTHAEFAKSAKAKDEAPQEKKVIAQPSGGILHKFISLIFPVPEGIKREAKWAQPWQTHAEHAKKAVVGEAPKEKKVVAAAGGGILDKLITLIFPSPTGGLKRDPKWAQPWQTHKGFQSRGAAAEPETVKTQAKPAPALAPVPTPKVEAKPPQVTKPEPIPAPASVPAAPPVPSPAPVPAPIVEIIPEPAPEPPKVEITPEPAPEPVPETIPIEPVVEPSAPEETFQTEEVAGDVEEDDDEGIDDDDDDDEDVTDDDVAEVEPEEDEGLGDEDEETEEEGDDEDDEDEDKEQEIADEAEEGEDKEDEDEEVVADDGDDEEEEDEEDEDKDVVADDDEEDDEEDEDEDVVEDEEEDEEDEDVLADEDDEDVDEDDEEEPVTDEDEEEDEEEEDEDEEDIEEEDQAKGGVEDEEEALDTEIDDEDEDEGIKVSDAVDEDEDVDEGEAAEDDDEDGDRDTSTDEGASGVVEDAPVTDEPVVDTPATPVEAVLEEAPEKEPVKEVAPKEEEEQIVVVPSAFRSRDRLEASLGLDETSQDTAARTDPIAEATLQELKKIYENTIKPLETLYKYQDISNRHVSDAELFGTPLILLVGPYSTGKSTFINYLMGVEYTKRALKTGTPPSHGVFRIIQYGETDQDLDGTDLSAHWSFASLQKFGQNFIDQLQGKAINVPLLKKVTFVEAPGILEMRRPGERLYPFNDVVQWFIDRADLILVMFDYTKLDAGYELEAILDQLKGREAQSRILLNKADQVPPEELIKVQGSLFWNLSPLLGVSTPPTVYAGSFTSRSYKPTSPAKLFQAQEDALLNDIAKAIGTRVDNRIAIARRHAVRVRNHAQMVDTYLTTFYKNKGFLTSKHKLAEDIIENPHLYNIYEGVSLLTNISRYDLPDPEIYRDFFRVHNLYDFQTLKETCSYFKGCPLYKIDSAISNDLPELLDRNRRLLEAAVAAPGSQVVNNHPVPTPAVRGSVPAAAHAQTS